jgi:hypothetical protein
MMKFISPKSIKFDWTLAVGRIKVVLSECTDAQLAALARRLKAKQNPLYLAMHKEDLEDEITDELERRK